MIGRRTFVGGLTAVASAMVGLAGSGPKDVIDPKEPGPKLCFIPSRAPELRKYVDFHGDLIYRDYRVSFRGWSSMLNQDVLIGHWLAHPVGPGPFYHPLRGDKYPHLVAGVPGESTPYMKGQVFWTGPVGDQRIVTSTTSEAEKEHERQKGFNRMIEMINCVKDSGLQGLSVHEWNEYLDQKGVRPRS